MAGILEFLERHSDALKLIFGGTSLLALLGKATQWLLGRRSRRAKIDSFDILPPRSDVTKKILGGADDDPLEARNIPYQERVRGRQIQGELERFLAQNRWVVIRGPKGIGKTREAVRLLQTLSDDGWTILNLRGPITASKAFSQETLGTSRRFLFFIDNLNQKMYGNPEVLEPEATDLLPVRVLPLQLGLLRTLEAYERLYGQEEVRVLATARDETEPEYEGEPSAWEKLAVDKYPEFWKRCTFYPLPKPDDAAVARVLEKVAEKAQVTVEGRKYRQISKRNDRTFANVVENLRRAKNRGGVLRLDDFQDTLKGTWRERYADAVRRYPAARHVYDAMDLLQAIQVEPTKATVLELATRISDPRVFRRAALGLRIRRALRYLEENEHILTPRDGQVEAKGYRADLHGHVPALAWVLERSFHRRVSIGRLSNFALVALSQGHYREVVRVYRRYLRIKPDDGEAWYWMGRAEAGLNDLKRAVDSFAAALAFDSRLYWAWLDRGDAEARLGRLQDALASYEKALASQPHDHQAWLRLGQVQLALSRFQDALASFGKVLEYKPQDEKARKGYEEAVKGLGRSPAGTPPALAAPPDPQPSDHEGWMSRGNAERLASYPREALISYGKALAARPDYAEAWYGKGLAFACLKRHGEAIACYEKALEINPGLYWALYDWGNAERDSGNLQAAIEKYRAAIGYRGDYADAWYGLGVALARMGETDKALDAYARALALDPTQHWIHLDRGEVLRQAGRYQESLACYEEAVRHKQDYPTAWHGRGLSLFALGRHDEAVAALSTALSQTETPQLWLDLCRVERSFGHLERALTCATKALKLKPRLAEAWYDRACCEALLGRRERAVRSLRSAIRKRPQYLADAKEEDCFRDLRDEIGRISCQESSAS